MTQTTPIILFKNFKENVCGGILTHNHQVLSPSTLLKVELHTHNFKESQTDFSFLLKVSITSVNAELHLLIPYIKRFTCWGVGVRLSFQITIQRDIHSSLNVQLHTLNADMLFESHKVEIILHCLISCA